MTLIILLVAFAFVVLLLAGLAGAIVLISKGRAKPSQAAPSEPEVYPFTTKALLSEGERAFFDVLRVAVGDGMFIFCKVRLIDLLDLPKGTPKRQKWVNKASQKHVDFVLCDRQSIRPLLVIELDDSSHRRETQRQRDADKDKALQAAGLPIRRVPARSSYDARQLAELIQKAIR